jgi:hypothetical protein
MATSVETHGLDCGPFERFDEEFIACLACGGRFDPTDWDGTHLSMSRHPLTSHGRSDHPVTPLKTTHK